MWVDLIVCPLGKVMVIGLRTGRLFVAGAFSTRKWPVAPESEIACLIDLVILLLLKIASARGNWYKLFAWTMVFHADVRVGIFTLDGQMRSFVGGLSQSSLFGSVRYDVLE